MLKKLKNWLIQCARSKAAQYWLCFIAFIENSIFPIPTDVLFVPMALLSPEKRFRYVYLASFFSTLGGIAGWLLGRFAYQVIAQPVLQFYGQQERFDMLLHYTTTPVMIALITSAGLFHLPPVKIITILSGVINFPLAIFVPIAFITRALRFAFLSWFTYHYGNNIIGYITLHRKTIFMFTMSILSLGLFLYYSHQI